ncbi:hypothetical protein Tco_1514845 [Tanacetum coccineum]
MQMLYRGVGRWSEAKNEFEIDVRRSNLVLMPRVVKSRDEIFSRWGYCDNHGLSRLICTPTIGLSNSGLEEFKQSKFEGYGVKAKKNFIEKFCSDSSVLTKSGLVPISTARQSSSRTAATVSTARPIKTAAPKPFVNVAKSRPNAFQKSHSPSRRPFYQQTALKNRNLNNKVNTVKVNSVNTAKGKRVTSVVGEQGIDAVKSKACWVWRPKLKVLDHVSKNSRSYMCKQFDYVDPTGRVKSVMAWVPKRN